MRDSSEESQKARKDELTGSGVMSLMICGEYILCVDDMGIEKGRVVWQGFGFMTG